MYTNREYDTCRLFVGCVIVRMVGVSRCVWVVRGGYTQECDLTESAISTGMVFGVSMRFTWMGTNFTTVDDSPQGCLGLVGWSHGSVN